MQIIVADFIYTPEGFVSGHAVAFGSTIEAVDTLAVLQARYPDASCITTPPNTILYPGFINTHVHLEFSANKTTLKYGAFMPWLDSVITHREDLVGACDNRMMYQACNTMLESGITSFGAISSFGLELEVCQKSPQRVVFFNELIGSNAMMADMLYGDFLERLNASKATDPSSRITPAIAIHSPYAVHPILIQKALTLAKQQHLPLSAHLLESPAEREWLEEGAGAFKPFFEQYFKSSTPVSSVEEFIHAFDTYPTHFTHCTQATQRELDYLATKGHSIAHCPRSNRYLGCGRLAIESLKLPFSVATDGLSSNDSLNLFDELRSAMMLHHQGDMTTLANQLIESVTRDGAAALHLNAGEIAVGKEADFTLITLPDTPERPEELALWTILHTQSASGVYIAGEQYV